MHHKARLLAALPLFVCACHVADVDAVYRHLHEKCELPFSAPACTGDEDANDRAVRVVVEHLSGSQLDTPEKERCVLDVDCSATRRETEPNGPLRDVRFCLYGISESALIDPPQLGECFDHCDDQLSICGEGSLACGNRDVVESCLDAAAMCNRSCSEVWGNNN